MALLLAVYMGVSPSPCHGVSYLLSHVPLRHVSTPPTCIYSTYAVRWTVIIIMHHYDPVLLSHFQVCNRPLGQVNFAAPPPPSASFPQGYYSHHIYQYIIYWEIKKNCEDFCGSDYSCPLSDQCPVKTDALCMTGDRGTYGCSPVDYY